MELMMAAQVRAAAGEGVVGRGQSLDILNVEAAGLVTD